MDGKHPVPATLHTSLCELLGIRYPVIQAGMAGGWTTPELVAAVSEAGGLGTVGAGRMTPDQLRDAIGRVRHLTTRPFGVNFLIAPPEPGNRDIPAAQARLDRVRDEMGLPPGPREIAPPPSYTTQALDVALDERVPVISFGLGDPTPFVDRIHAAGARVVAMATTVEEARRLEDGGADVVVAQGAEAGGHRGTFKVGPGGDVPLVGAMALVPQVADAVDVPVVAAGGIVDGRGLLAALALGASGVQIGTRFLVARESGAFPAYRERLLGGTEADTIVTRAFTGRPARAVRNRFIEQFRETDGEPLAWPLQSLAADDIYRAAQMRDDAEHFPLLAGQGLRLLKRDQGAGEMVHEIMVEGRAILSLLRDLAG